MNLRRKLEILAAVTTTFALFQNFTWQPTLTSVDPRIYTAFVTSTNSIGVVTNSADSTGSLWLYSPTLNQWKGIEDLPIDQGRIRVSWSQGNFSAEFTDQLKKDGLLVYVKQPSGKFYVNRVALHSKQFGRNDSSYRRTQLQGIILNKAAPVEPSRYTVELPGLRNMPASLSDASLDFPYRRKGAVGSLEVPLVNKVTINKVFGGYNGYKSEVASPELRNSKDLAFRDADGKIQYRFQNFLNGIRPYLEAGYRPSDMTIGLESVPWDLSTETTCRLDGKPMAGDWGNRAMPSKLDEWKALNQNFAQFLKDNIPGAEGFSFKIGSEFNTLDSFCGDSKDYFNLYLYATKGVRSVFPNAVVKLTEFAGGVRADLSNRLSVDMPTVFDWLLNAEIPTGSVNRSCHSFPDLRAKVGLPAMTTTEVAALCANTMKEVYANAVATKGLNASILPHEIYQFGQLGDGLMDWREHYDMGPRNASWHLMTGMKLKQQINLKWLAHWDPLFDKFASTDFIYSGVAWLYQILDHTRNFTQHELEVVSPLNTIENEVFAMATYDSQKLYLIVSTLNPDVRKGRVWRDVNVVVPKAILPSMGPGDLRSGTYKLRQVEFLTANSPVAYIRGLVADGKIKGVRLKAPYAADLKLIGRTAQMVELNDPSFGDAKTTDAQRDAEAFRRISVFLTENAEAKAGLERLQKSLFTLKDSTSTLTSDASGRLILSSKNMDSAHVRVFEVTRMP